jgi:DNA-binding IclR family transcriptional regulator
VRKIVTAFAKSLRVLNLVVTMGTVTASDVAGNLELPVSTCRRHLKLLEHSGFVTESHGNFTAGPRLAAEVNPHANPSSLAVVSTPVLERLQEQTRETATCVVRAGLHGVVLHEVESGYSDRVVHRRGQLTPLHAGAAQRVLLAFAPLGVLEALLQGGLEPLAPGTMTERDLRSSLEAIRQSGVAVSRDEIESGNVEVAVAVTVGGVVVCSLSVTGPASRCDREWQTKAVHELRESGRLLREMLAD